MKWTTANVKNPNYTANHEIYVGTHTGSFKKFVPAYEENPFAQSNLQDLKSLDKDSRITALEFGNDEKSEILIGRANNIVQLHSLRSENVANSIELQAAPVVGLARNGNQLIAGFGTGQIQRISLEEKAAADAELPLLTAGDDMAHLHQCPTQRNLVAAGGKGRQNNLKIYDMAADGKQVFTSKNLPNDYLQLEVPVWDSDVGFIDSPHVLATCSRHGYVRVYDTRKQRRPVQCYATEQQMSFTTLAAQGNYIYTGTTMGAMKAFDIRRMKTFVHTYKGFTGGISDVHLDATGKYLASACLDRYVRVHHVDSCVLLYQCYVKSKATRVLIRESMENPNSNANIGTEEEEDEAQEVRKEKKKGAVSDDEEYDEIFDKMPTICEKPEDGKDPAENNDDVDDDDEEEEDIQANRKEAVSSSKTKEGSKRKLSAKVSKNKKKKQ